MSLKKSAKLSLKNDIKELDLSSSSSKFNWNEGSLEQIQEFPDIETIEGLKLLSPDSEDDSAEISKIKTKNSEILQAFKSSLKNLQNKSKEFISSFNDEEFKGSEKSVNGDLRLTENSEKFVYLNTEPFSERDDRVSQLKDFVDRIKKLKSTIAESKEWIEEEQSIIKKIDHENEGLTKLLEQVVGEICGPSEGDEKCGCVVV